MGVGGSQSSVPGASCRCRAQGPGCKVQPAESQTGLQPAAHQRATLLAFQCLWSALASRTPLQQDALRCIALRVAAAACNMHLVGLLSRAGASCNGRKPVDKWLYSRDRALVDSLLKPLAAILLPTPASASASSACVRQCSPLPTSSAAPLSSPAALPSWYHRRHPGSNQPASNLKHAQRPANC